MKIADLKKHISEPAAKGHLIKAITGIDYLLKNETGVYWNRELLKLRAFFVDGVPRHTIIPIDEDQKVPFHTFSTLPIETCPGMGECESICYSLKSHRYPSSYCIQVQNTVLLRTKKGRAHIAQAFHDVFANGPEMDFRLYVNGDIDSVETARFWFDLFKQYPNCLAYGYTKSLIELLALNSSGYQFPANYMFNLSNGHRFNTDIENEVKKLSIYRGEFIAVDLGYRVNLKAMTREQKLNVIAIHKEKTGRKGFICPTRCGSCTPNGHACGSARFKNIDILVAVH